MSNGYSIRIFFQDVVSDRWLVKMVELLEVKGQPLVNGHGKF